MHGCSQGNSFGIQPLGGGHKDLVRFLIQFLVLKTILQLFRGIESITRGVQYVHCVMHKCIMVKLRGKRKTRKVGKKEVNFSKSEGNLKKMEGIKNFPEIGGNVVFYRK